MLPSTLRAVLLLLVLASAAACGDSVGGAGGDGRDAGLDVDSANDVDATSDGDSAGDATDGGDPDDVGDVPAAVPGVVSTVPRGGAAGVSLNANVAARFSERMDGATLTAATFTVTVGDPAVPVPGRVSYANATAVFWPDALLAVEETYTATIASTATSTDGVALPEDFSWNFTTGDSVAAPLPVDLGTAGTYAVLAKSAISTVPGSAITGDIGISPAAATFITGFSLTADATNVFSTSTQVSGRVYAANYAPPSPANLTTAISDIEIAFTAAAGRAPDVVELGAGNIGGMTLRPGVYKWGTGLLIPTAVTLAGSATDVWIFQIAGDLTIANGSNVILSGGALPKNVFWQAAGFMDLGTTAHAEGIFLCQTAITLHTGASVNGTLLAQTAVVLDQSTVVAPAR